jgi:hypothetical protein
VRLAAVLALVVGVLASTAGAAQRVGTARSDTIRGTARADYIDPRAGRDRVSALGGNDRIKAQDRFVDSIRCGRGLDLVTADLRDSVARDCEVVVRQLSRDPYRNPESQHATEVEPDSYAFGATVSTVFQVGRIRDGAAANIGFSSSRDAGRTWRSGLLPSLTANSSPRGNWARASDPVVGYDAQHGTWLASSLAVTPGQESALVFNRSSDGIRWGAPVVATSSFARGETLLDKQWFACDNWTSSPFRGHCYLAYSDFRTDRISIQTSTDGGATWSAPIGAPDNAGRESMRTGAPGVQPVVRPNGDLLILYWDANQMSSIRSTDGGATFSTTQFVARAQSVAGFNFRAFPLPVAESTRRERSTSCGPTASCAARAPGPTSCSRRRRTGSAGPHPRGFRPAAWRRACTTSSPDSLPTRSARAGSRSRGTASRRSAGSTRSSSAPPTAAAPGPPRFGSTARR